MARLNRVELHELIWRHPVATIAQALRISGNALSKTCKKHGIPTPGRGYWARVQNGESIPRVELTNPGDKTETPIDWTEEAAQELDRLRELEGARLREARRGAGSAGAKKTTSSPPKRAASRAKDEFVQRVADASSDTQDPAVSLSSRWGDLEYLIGLAQRQNELDGVLQFAERIVQSASSQDPQTLAVALLLREHIRRQISRGGPLVGITEICRLVAVGKEKPGWWMSWEVSDQPN